MKRPEEIYEDQILSVRSLYQVKIITFKDGRPIAVKKSYVPGVLRLNDPLESIAIRNFPFRISKMYFARRTCKIQQTAAGAVQPSWQKR